MSRGCPVHNVIRVQKIKVVECCAEKKEATTKTRSGPIVSKAVEFSNLAPSVAGTVMPLTWPVASAQESTYARPHGGQATWPNCPNKIPPVPPAFSNQNIHCGSNSRCYIGVRNRNKPRGQATK